MKSLALRRVQFALIETRVTLRSTMKTSHPLGCALWTTVLALCTPATHASNISYTYDPAGRLVAADYGGGRSTSYAYDSAGNLLQTTAPAPSFALGPVVNHQLSLWWPANPGGFTLEAATTLGPGAPWTVMTPAPVLIGNQYGGTVNVGSGVQFFRLRKP